MTAILETRGLAKRFGGVHVARGIDFALEAGEMHCLIGPNGAGKSSFFRLVLGEYYGTGDLPCYVLGVLLGYWIEKRWNPHASRPDSQP